MPLTYFIFAACILFYAFIRYRRPAFLVLGGWMAGFTAWTKNEGSLFLVVVIFSMIVLHSQWSFKGTVKGLLPFGLGVLLPSVTVAYFKLTLAPPSDLFGNRTAAELFPKLIDFSRYSVTVREMGKHFLEVGSWWIAIVPILLIYACVFYHHHHQQHRPAVRFVVLVLLLTLLGYVGVIIVTPHPLEWHLNYSADRLVFHFFPALIFLVLTSVSSPEELLAQLRARKPAVEAPLSRSIGNRIELEP